VAPRDPQNPSLGQPEQSTFGFIHAHSGLSGDGRKVKAASLDTTDPFAGGGEPIYIPVNALTSGRRYRIQIIEVTDPETSQIQAVIQVVGAP